EQYLYNFWSFVGTELNQEWWNALRSLTNTSMQIPGMLAGTPQSRSVFAPQATPFRGPLVQPQAPAQNEPRHPDYIEWLSSAGYQRVGETSLHGSGPRPLLYRLLRHSMLLEYAAAAFRLATPGDRLEPELIDMNPSAQSPTITPLRRLEQDAHG